MIVDVTRDDFYDLEAIERDVFGKDGFSVYLLEEYYRYHILYQKLVFDSNLHQKQSSDSNDASGKIIGFFITSPLDIDDMPEILQGIVNDHIGGRWGVRNPVEKYDKVAHLVNFVILRQFWNQGFGTKLIHHIIKESKKMKYKYILLEVNDTNERAINLYKKNKFSVIGTIKSYYESGATCLVMIHDL